MSAAPLLLDSRVRVVASVATVISARCQVCGLPITRRVYANKPRMYEYCDENCRRYLMHIQVGKYDKVGLEIALRRELNAYVETKRAEIQAIQAKLRVLGVPFDEADYDA